MKSLLGLLVITLVALFGSRLVEKSGHVPDLFQRLFAGGWVFILFGILLGPSLLGVIDHQVVLRLSPIVTIGLFWIAFLFGFHLSARDLRRISEPVFAFAFGQSIFAMAVVGVASWFFLVRFFPGLDYSVLAVAAATLAACASGTNQSTLLRLTYHPRFRGTSAQLAAVTATLDDLPAILVTGGLTFFWHRSLAGEVPLPGIVWLAAAVFLGVFGGFVMKGLLDKAENEQVRLLMVMGCFGIGGGLSAYLHLSPIFIGAVMGATFANIGGRDEKVFDVLHRSEGTFYVLFLVLAGGMLRITSAALPLLVLIYLVFRIAAKVLGGYIFLPGQWRARGEGPPRLIGLALLSQGGMALAFAIHYKSLYPSAIADPVVAVIIFGVIVNELFSYPLALRIAGRGTS